MRTSAKRWRGGRARAVLAAAAWIALAAGALGAQPVPGESQYRLGPRDMVRIRVFEVPELNVEGRVSENGSVSLPLIGEVPAEGLTDQEFASRLKGLLESRYVNRASVSVEVVELRSRPIVLMGAVARPGNLAFPGRWSLLDAIAAAGGLTENHGDTIYVLRRASNGLSEQLAIPVADLLVRGVPEVNIPIFANDLINVPPQVTVTVYCLGEVRQPGAVTFRSSEPITVLAALARAGGLTERAAKKITIRRRGGAEAAAREVVADYRRILSGKEPDPELEEGDVVVVKEAFF